MRNFEGINEVVASIKMRLLRGWAIDEVLARTESQLELERNQCRLSEIALKTIQLEHGARGGIYLGIGLALAFVILVLADFIQSFFDTATNTRSILARLESSGSGGH